MPEAVDHSAPMRIAVVGIAPDSVHLLTYVRHLAAAGHDVTLITNRYDASAPVRVMNFARHTRLAKALTEPALHVVRSFRIAQALRSCAPDVMSVQQMTPDGVCAALVSRVPTVLSFWGSDILRLHARPWWVRRLMPMAIRRAALIHSPSREITEALTALGADPDRIETFQYGIDLRTFPLRSDAPVPGRIVSTRGLRPFYRIETIVRAMPRVLAERPDASLVLAGDGGPGDADALRELVSELGLGDRVTFPGRLGPDDVAACLREGEVWVSVPPSDGTPLSMLEAMASGPLPVVTDMATMRDWLDEERAVFVSEPTPDAVADALLAGLARAGARTHEAPNRDVVGVRGDCAVNLPRYESMLRRVARPSAARTRSVDTQDGSSRARVAVCTSVHPSSDARVTFREGRALARAFDTTLYLLEDGPDSSVDAGGGRRLAMRRLGRRAGRLARFLAGGRLLGAAMADRPDALVIMDPELLPWARALAVGRVLTVYDAHEDYAVMMLTKAWLPTPVRRLVSALVDRVERSVLRRFDLLVVADRHLLDRLGRAGVRGIVVRNYPPTDLITPGPPLHERQPVVAYVGGVSPQRGLPAMLDAFALVRGRVPDARLLLIGPAQDGVGAALAEAGPGVVVSDRISYDRVGGELARARVGLALLADTPKYRRDVPSKLYDYMAAGVPFVASDLPGIRSTVGEAGGLLVDPADPTAAAEAIVRLLTDDEEAARRREGGLAAVRSRFAFEHEAAGLVDAIARSLAARLKGGLR